MENINNEEQKPAIIKFDKDSVRKEYESKLIQYISEYTKHRLTKEQLLGFFNNVSQYFSVVNGLNIEDAREVVTSSDIEHKSKSSIMRNLSLGYCPKEGNQLAVSNVFVKAVSSRFVPSKQLLTAGVILVGHESTHNKQNIMEQRADDGLWELTEEQREFLSESGMDSSAGNMQEVKKVLKNISSMRPGKVDGPHFQLLFKLGSYFGNVREIDARQNGITFCKTLYDNLLENPEIENYPEVKEWIAKQDKMIGLHEKVEGFLDKKIINNYRRFVESCNVPIDKLLKFAENEEKEWAGNEENLPKNNSQISIYYNTIRLAIKNKSLKELEEMASQIDESKAPILKEILDKSIENTKKYATEKVVAPENE